MVPVARVLADRRLLVSVVALLGVANLVGLALVVGPMRLRVQGLTARATSASLAASLAARDLQAARATAAGSVTAVDDLRRFYGDILPASQPAARQITFVRLAQLAQDANLTYDHRSFEQETPDKEAVLTRATMTASVFGRYRDLRDFLYALETGDDFVVIREVRVVQPEDMGKSLEAALTLSTYYKASDGR